MPGVHADVGGCSDGRFLADVSLLTMLSRLRKYCPELLFKDEGEGENEIRKNISEASNLTITNERDDVFRKLLRRSSRNAGKRIDQCYEYTHPVVKAMTGKRFIQRGGSDVYRPSVDCAGMPTVDLGEDSVFLTNAVEQLPHRFGPKTSSGQLGRVERRWHRSGRLLNSRF
jgi:hypothetical protein